MEGKALKSNDVTEQQAFFLSPFSPFPLTPIAALHHWVSTFKLRSCTFRRGVSTLKFKDRTRMDVFKRLASERAKLTPVIFWGLHRFRWYIAIALPALVLFSVRFFVANWFLEQGTLTVRSLWTPPATRAQWQVRFVCLVTPAFDLVLVEDRIPIFGLAICLGAR